MYQFDEGFCFMLHINQIYVSQPQKYFYPKFQYPYIQVHLLISLYVKDALNQACIILSHIIYQFDQFQGLSLFLVCFGVFLYIFFFSRYNIQKIIIIIDTVIKFTFLRIQKTIPCTFYP